MERSGHAELHVKMVREAGATVEQQSQGLCPHFGCLFPVVWFAANMPTQLEMAMDTMIRIFHRYSCKEGDRFKLNKGELKLLLQRELTEFLSCQKDPQLVDKIMQDLDANKDNEVDFNEFVVMVAALTVACNDYFVEQLKKKGK
ncbi:PREDICTED: protein S100-Z isoform X1 [Chinchilla lanigera]|uniref:protein S100-Z isoform X1 n=1 Tax=Chinchilla lanigera TaxID=34839 RepID=UPI00038EBEA5|nr:PREDICTED: protein S100-Z isoform X1 [Chinchilla lanigera]